LKKRKIILSAVHCAELHAPLVHDQEAVAEMAGVSPYFYFLFFLSPSPQMLR
jgi:hypothetical protein